MWQPKWKNKFKKYNLVKLIQEKKNRRSTVKFIEEIKFTIREISANKKNSRFVISMMHYIKHLRGEKSTVFINFFIKYSKT